MCCACNNIDADKCQLLFATRAFAQCDRIRSHHRAKDDAEHECPDATGSSQEWIDASAEDFARSWRREIVDEILKHKWIESEQADGDVGLHYALDDWFHHHNRRLLPHYLEARKRFGRTDRRGSSAKSVPQQMQMA